MPYEITQFYLPPGRGDIPAVTPAETGTRLSDPGGMQGWVDLVGWLQPEMVYPLEDGHQSQTGPDVRYITSFMPPTKRHAANRYVYLPLPGTKPSRKSLRTLSKIINDIFNKDTKTMSSVTHLENFPQSLLYNYSLQCMVNVAYLQSRCFTPCSSPYAFACRRRFLRKTRSPVQT